VHPSLERISAWVSSLGAAATLADLDGDGLPNDVIYVDPRTDLVTVAPFQALVNAISLSLSIARFGRMVPMTARRSRRWAALPATSTKMA
jgi:hypothetical protein